MSTTEPEALRLAEILEGGSNQYRSEAAAELRRQHAEIAHADRYAEQMGRELSKATAEIADLRARLASIAGGVSPLMGAAGDAGWQSIETAPKDGTLIVLGAHNGVWLGKYLPVYGSGYVPDNPWSSMLLNHDHMAERYTRPTHWMPLPPAPSSAKGVAL